ncbi:MAG TPA: hypothetical protein VED63_13225 [Acidimicrobiales bacterium]|nr:hypothetical protein [Acidimicrobiales bacterium]
MRRGLAFLVLAATAALGGCSTHTPSYFNGYNWAAYSSPARNPRLTASEQCVLWAKPPYIVPGDNAAQWALGCAAGLQARTR